MAEKMWVKIIPVGMLETNCYILGDPETRSGIVIDPGAELEKIAAVIERASLKIKYIINTHGHYDHIGADRSLKEICGAEILIHREDAEMLSDPALNLSFADNGNEIENLKADKVLEDGDVINIGDILLKVIHTPGHTPGSICLLTGNEIFTGDTLFAGSAGRTDLPGGSYEQLVDSIHNKIKPLPGHLKVYPGHGPTTTIEVEKSQNPFM